MKNITEVIVNTIGALKVVFTTSDNFANLSQRRVFTAEDAGNHWAVEVVFSERNRRRPTLLRAVWFGEDENNVITYADSPTEEGVERLGRWLKAMRELGL